MNIDYLLTATRSARKSLDLEAPVHDEELRACLRTGLQAANGSNQQSWRWLVVSEPGLRASIAALYRDAYLQRVGGQMIAHLVGDDTAEGRLLSSTEWLAEHMARVPVLVIPCYEPTMPRVAGDELFYQATLYGSVFPAVWNFQLALHTRGYGSCITTLHLHHAQQIGQLLGIPAGYQQGCLLPVARLRAGVRFRAAPRRPLAEVLGVNGWEPTGAHTPDRRV